MKLLLSFLLSMFLVTLPGEKFIRVASVPVSASYFTTDHLGHAYAIAGNQLMKYDSTGKLLFTYSHSEAGVIKTADVSDPLDILLFSPGFGKIIFLDRTLSPKGPSFSLFTLGLRNITLSCSSRNNGFWIYDADEMQLKKIDRSLKVAQQSGDLAQLTGGNLDPDFMVEWENQVFMNNPQSGILVFDAYGSYLKTLPLKGLRNFQAGKETLVYSRNNMLYLYHLKSFEEISYPLPAGVPDSTMVYARLERDRLFIQRASAIDIYTTLP